MSESQTYKNTYNQPPYPSNKLWCDICNMSKCIDLNF